MTLLSTLRSKIEVERTSASALAGSLLVLEGHFSRTRFTRQRPLNPFWAFIGHVILTYHLGAKDVDFERIAGAHK